MNLNKGSFVISLDYELMWGVRDKRTIENYGDAILGTRDAMGGILDSFETYKIRATFAAVGFLFFPNREKLLQNLPSILPGYTNRNLSPYPDIENYIGINEMEDPYYFGKSVIDRLKNNSVHELATHTFCHFYCLEEGQNLLQFESDLKYAIAVAKQQGVKISSIVFPRNQYTQSHLDICFDLGIKAFRGTEKSSIYISGSDDEQTLIKRAIRLLDSYVNITGFNCYSYEFISQSKPYNIPSSRFLRPFSSKLAFLENYKLRRIKKAMTHAAKNGLVYHLWWHPHNFGRNTKKNMDSLNDILKHFKMLKKKYDFQSLTMRDLSESINRQKCE